MLIVFDVDGTLVGGEFYDWSCFDQAIETVLGFEPTKEFFRSIPEITAQSIAVAAIGAANCQPGTGLEEKIRDEYLRRLRLVHNNDPHAFPARNGITALLSHLSSLPDVDVAIATGDWFSTSTFKLGAAGIDFSRYAMATSSDVARRSEIIKLAALRAGRPLSEVVYIGDGVWDIKACRELRVPFIGTGTRLDVLKEAGAEHLMEVLEHVVLLDKLQLVFKKAVELGPAQV
jgi:phosphoglycolate phosphatase-like HAD superfamily hydrolase